MYVLLAVMAAVLFAAVYANAPDDAPGVHGLTARDGASNPVVLTISGTVVSHDDAVGRPGCVLTLTDGRTTGRYYVPVPDARSAYPVGKTAVLRAYQDTLPVDGIYETL